MYMGSCFSSTATEPTAQVVSLDGDLREYSGTVSVSQVLSPHHPSCFVCNSDSLYYNTHISALCSNEFLQPGQLYFVLPVAMLEKPLTTSEMMALAVKASSALASATGKHGHRRRLRVMPVADMGEELDGFIRLNEKSIGGWGTKTARMKVRRSASLRVREARWSSRTRLNTIEEVAE